MHRKQQISSRHHGLITAAVFIPILLAAFLSAALCFCVSIKLSEALQMQSDSIAVDNAFMQAKSVLYESFAEKIVSGQITADFSASSVPSQNPKIAFEQTLLNDIAKTNSKLDVNSYIVDENYDFNWMTTGQKYGIPKRTPDTYMSDSGNECSVRYFMLVTEIRPLHALNSAVNVYTTECAVYLVNGKLSVKELYTRKKIIQN